MSKSPHHGNPLFLCVYFQCRGNRPLQQATLHSVVQGVVRCRHGSRLFCERYDISFYSLEQYDISFYSHIRYIVSSVAGQK